MASIVTWNHAHCIEKCIASLLAQTELPQEIVVYDNASTDQTSQVLERFSQPIRLIRSPENRGFCSGHNAVIQSTKSELVLLVNPDVVLAEDYIEKGVERMESEPSLGTVCGLLVQSDPADRGCLVDGAGLRMCRSRRLILRHRCAPLHKIKPEASEVFGADGALPLFRRKMIEDVSIEGQFFDPMFFAHKEDHDVAWRAQIYGWKTVFHPACVAVHPRHFKPGDRKLRRRIQPEIKYHAIKNDLILLLKNEDLSNFLKDCHHILPRRIAILAYVLLFERSSLRAYSFVFKNLATIVRHRKAMMRNRRVLPPRIRRAFLLG